MIEWISLIIAVLALIHSIGMRILKIKICKEIDENTITNNKNFEILYDDIVIINKTIEMLGKNNADNWIKISKLNEIINKERSNKNDRENNI